MRVLILVEDFRPNVGGIATFLENVCAELCRHGNEVHVLAPLPSAEVYLECDSDVPWSTHRYRVASRVSSLSVLWSALSSVAALRPDVILLGHFFSTRALWAPLAQKLLGVPYAILVHGTDIGHSFTASSVDRWASERVLRSADCVLANSHFTKSRVVSHGYPEGRIKLLHPGVDVARFQPGIEVEELRTQLGLAGRRVLLSVGRLRARKGQDRVIRALPMVQELVPDAAYLIVGDGEERDGLRALASQLRIDSSVVFAGRAEAAILPAIYNLADLFVMPSHALDSNGCLDYEGFGIAFVEASACGKPVIGGRSGGISDAVIDGETGILVDPHDVDSIASAIIRVLSDAELARRLGENGWRHADRELCWQRVGARLESYLEAVVCRKKGLERVP